MQIVIRGEAHLQQASLDSSKTSEQAAVAEAQSLETDDHYQNPKGDAAEEDEDSIVAEMMKVDWKVSYLLKAASAL